ncbi:MAG: phosphopantetheine-binding protein [Acidobacteria bacterium]|jgi:hypothetical protein|nr:phosphopantetheine-binding protein [Acidobacteriota bacterium]
MIYLGLVLSIDEPGKNANHFYQVQAAALIADGAVVSAIDTQKLQKIKKDIGPFAAIRYVIRDYGIQLKDVNKVAVFDTHNYPDHPSRNNHRRDNVHCVINGIDIGGHLLKQLQAEFNTAVNGRDLFFVNPHFAYLSYVFNLYSTTMKEKFLCLTFHHTDREISTLILRGEEGNLTILDVFSFINLEQSAVEKIVYGLKGRQKEFGHNSLCISGNMSPPSYLDEIIQASGIFQDISFYAIESASMWALGAGLYAHHQEILETSPGAVKLSAVKLSATPTYAAPGNRLEKELAKIWATILKAEPIGIKDDFFQLGGNSLDAIRAIAIAAEQNINITLKHFLQYRTIEQIVINAVPHQTPFSIDRKYNKEFQRGESYPYFYSCFLSCIIEKLQYEENIRFNRDICLLAEGNTLPGYVYNDEMHFKYIFLFPYSDLAGMKGITHKLNIRVNDLHFNNLKDIQAYMKKQLSAQRLVFVDVSTYFLHYTKDYQQDKETFLQEIVTRPYHTLHSVLVVDMVEESYLIYDPNFDFYGRVPAEDFHNSLQGFSAIDFMMNHPARENIVPYHVHEIDTHQVLALDDRILAANILSEYIEKYTSLVAIPFRHENETYRVHIGLGGLRQVIDQLEKLPGSQQNSEQQNREKISSFFERYYEDIEIAIIAFRNFLESFCRYFPTLKADDFIPSLNEMICEIKQVRAGAKSLEKGYSIKETLSRLMYFYHGQAGLLSNLKVWLDNEIKHSVPEHYE